MLSIAAGRALVARNGEALDDKRKLTLAVLVARFTADVSFVATRRVLGGAL